MPSFIPTSLPSPTNKAGCPTGCGCSGFVIALLLWTPAMIVARANSGVGTSAIGITLLVAIPLGVLLLLAMNFSRSGVSRDDRKTQSRPYWLFAATYFLTFLACLIATFFIARSGR